MAGTGPADLHLLALEYLEACVEALETIPGSPDTDPGLVGAPDRYFISPGVPAMDCCDQLAVYTRPLSKGSQAGGPPKASMLWINHVRLSAHISRCVPVPDSSGNPPLPADQELAAEQINADAWALWNYVQNKVVAGLLFEMCGDVTDWFLGAVNPQGGCAGSIFSVTVQLDGYESTFGS